MGTRLVVTPQVSAGGRLVHLKIKQELSSSNGLDKNNQYTFSERKIETAVEVESGQIIAIGGLVRDEVIEVETKVPFLGDIPILGELFKSTRESAEKKI